MRASDGKYEFHQHNPIVYSLEELYPAPQFTDAPHPGGAPKVDTADDDHQQDTTKHEEGLQHVRIHHRLHPALYVHVCMYVCITWCGSTCSNYVLKELPPSLPPPPIPFLLPR